MLTTAENTSTRVPVAIEAEILCKTTGSDCFRAECAYLARGGIRVSEQPRLLKHIDEKRVRIVFPTDASIVDEGTVIGMVCLFDRAADLNVYAHCISAGPGVNAQLRSVYSPLNQVMPQPGVAGYKAVGRFIAWKQAAWNQFLTEDLEFGAEEASRRWLARFWSALDRMYGGGHLRGS